MGSRTYQKVGGAGVGVGAHDGDKLLDDVLDEVGPVVADVDVILLPDVGKCLKNLKVKKTELNK